MGRPQGEPRDATVGCCAAARCGKFPCGWSAPFRGTLHSTRRAAQQRREDGLRALHLGEGLPEGPPSRRAAEMVRHREQGVAVPLRSDSERYIRRGVHPRRERQRHARYESVGGSPPSGHCPNGSAARAAGHLTVAERAAGVAVQAVRGRAALSDRCTSRCRRRPIESRRCSTPGWCRCSPPGRRSAPARRTRGRCTCRRPAPSRRSIPRLDGTSCPRRSRRLPCRRRPCRLRLRPARRSPRLRPRPRRASRRNRASRRSPGRRRRRQNRLSPSSASCRRRRGRGSPEG